MGKSVSFIVYFVVIPCFLNGKFEVSAATSGELSDNENYTVTCGSGTTIDVTAASSARYHLCSTTDSATEDLTTLGTKCNGKTTCAITVNSDDFFCCSAAGCTGSVTWDCAAATTTTTTATTAAADDSTTSGQNAAQVGASMDSGSNSINFTSTFSVKLCFTIVTFVTLVLCM